MSKQVSSGELSIIVHHLLMDPTSIGQLDDAKTHKEFTQAIADTVAQFCGGRVGREAGVNDEYGSQNLQGLNISSPYFVSVHPNEDLPSLENNVWSLFDPISWQDEDPKEIGIDQGTPMTDTARREQANLLTSTMLKTAVEEARLLGADSTQARIHVNSNGGGEYKTLDLTIRDMSINIVQNDHEIVLEPKTGLYGDHILASAYCPDTDGDGPDMVASVYRSGAYIEDKAAEVNLASEIFPDDADEQPEGDFVKVKRFRHVDATADEECLYKIARSDWEAALAELDGDDYDDEISTIEEDALDILMMKCKVQRISSQGDFTDIHETFSTKVTVL